MLRSFCSACQMRGLTIQNVGIAVRFEILKMPAHLAAVYLAAFRDIGHITLIGRVRQAQMNIRAADGALPALPGGEDIGEAEVIGYAVPVNWPWIK